MNEDSVKNFVSNIKCENCGELYQPNNANVIARQGDMWIFSVYCSSCEIKSVVAAVIKDGNSMEMITDLNETEQATFITPVCSDDVLDMHIVLDDFDGDFASLFNDNEPIVEPPDEPLDS